MKVHISTDAIDLTIVDGRIKKFEIDGHEDVNKFMKGISTLVRVLDDIMVETVTVCHMNHAIKIQDNESINKIVTDMELGMCLYCHCKNCLLSYLRSSIKAADIADNSTRVKCLRVIQSFDEDGSTGSSSSSSDSYEEVT